MSAPHMIPAPNCTAADGDKVLMATEPYFHLTGPDLRKVPPLEQQLNWLAMVEGRAADYAAIWISVVAEVGDASVMVERDGTECLMLGQHCDSQHDDRRQRMDAFADHLRNSGHRKAVIDLLWRKGRACDNRPNDARATTQIVRDYVSTGGRIMINPGGELLAGAGIPKDWGVVSDERDEEIERATRAYRDLRRRHRAEPHIRRIVRLAGHRTSNGWLVLEGAQA